MSASGRVRATLWLAASRMGLLVAVFMAYSWFRKTYFLQPPETAFANALEIIDLQRALGIAVTRVELPLQQWALEHPWLIDALNTYYRQFKPSLYACALFCLLLAPVQFHRVLKVFLIATVIAVPWYAIYPLAPPRLMEPHGFPFVDTLAVYGGTVSSAEGAGGANQYAAMPSMHIGWTTIAALWLAAALPRRRIGLIIGIVHVSLMCLTVIVTGNHYTLDIVAGFAVAGVAIVLARFLPVELPRSGWRGLDRPRASTERAAEDTGSVRGRPPALPQQGKRGAWERR